MRGEGREGKGEKKWKRNVGEKGGWEGKGERG